MRARILTTAAALLAAILPAGAADPQLLNLVMPNAQVLAGMNVDQAKTSAFGQYVLAQMQQNANLPKLTAVTGFDPTQDVSEILVASGGPASKTGLVVARGNFDPAKIAAAAAQGNAATENYRGVSILEDPKQTHGVAFLNNNTIAAAGDLASVKGAIDRQLAPGAPLPAAVIMQVTQWSGAQDAWVITTVPPSSLHPPANAPAVPGLPGPNGVNATFQAIQSAAAGVKFANGAAIVTAQAQADNAQDATNMAGALQLLASMAQLQAQKNPELQAISQSLKVTTDGTALNVTFSLPENDLQALLKPHAHPNRRRAPMNGPVRQ